MNIKNNLTKKYSDLKHYLNHFKIKKQFNIFWNKLTVEDQKRILLLIGINNQPIPSLTHLKAELFIVKNCYSEPWHYGGLES